MRQGSIISPWIFNCFYRDMVKTVNDIECGLIIGNNRYNIICYADDLLLTSATSTGLQTLINSCQKYVEEHGLCFNPTKTSCTVIGKSPFTTEATFYISGVKLQNAKTFKYLGAELGNLSHTARVKQRIRATNGAFHKLQAAGLHMRGLSPEAVRHVYLLAILPIMTYAAHALHLTRTDIKTMESTHGNIIKSSLGLSKYSRTSPLIASLDIQRVESMINNHTINLLRRCLMGDSLASQLYWTLYKQGELDDKTLIGRASHLMQNNELTFTKTIFNDIVHVNTKSVLFEHIPHRRNGLID